MRNRLLARTLVAPAHLHIACAAAALLCCLPLLFPGMLPASVTQDLTPCLGAGILVALALSLLLLGASACLSLAHLRNLRALGLVVAWAAIWGMGAGAFCLVALLANVPAPPEPKAPEPIQTTDTLHSADEPLLSPGSMVIPISTEGMPADKLCQAPNLCLLEEKHPQLLKQYMARSPRWEPDMADKAFYSRPDHLVLALRPQGLVHVAFLRLAGGKELPEGYMVFKPGEAVPKAKDAKEQIPDVALDLGGDHYLLLAWRGTAHAETAWKAVNAAISCIDTRFKRLAESPTHETVLRMLDENKSIPGTAPEMRLCAVPTQEGCYQAEFYVNTHEGGTLQVRIIRLDTGKLIGAYSMPARVSARQGELLRHDLPGSVPAWARSGNKLAQDSPLFSVAEADKPDSFGVAFELWFTPYMNADEHRMLLRRCYSVQPYTAGRDSEKVLDSLMKEEK